jgi:hypothetical protein
MNILNLIAQTITLLPLIMSGDGNAMSSLPAIASDGSYQIAGETRCLHMAACDNHRFGNIIVESSEPYPLGTSETVSFRIAGVYWQDGHEQENFVGRHIEYTNGAHYESYTLGELSNTSIASYTSTDGTKCNGYYEDSYQYTGLAVDQDGNHAPYGTMENICD